MIIVTCPHCSARFKNARNLAGANFTCPTCKRRFRVAAMDSPPGGATGNASPPEATSNWYCKFGDRVIGPLTSTQMLEMAKAGQLRQGDLVSAGETGKWTSVGQLEWIRSLIASPGQPESTSAPRPSLAREPNREAAMGRPRSGTPTTTVVDQDASNQATVKPGKLAGALASKDSLPPSQGTSTEPTNFVACPFCSQPIANLPMYAGRVVGCPTCSRQIQMPPASVQGTQTSPTTPTEFYILINQTRHGPYTIDQLKSIQVPPDALFWCQGQELWVPASAIPELRSLFQATPRQSTSDFAIVGTGTGSHGKTLARSDRSWDELRLIASRQRRLIIGIGLSCLAYLLIPIILGGVVVAIALGLGLNPESDPAVNVLSAGLNFVLALAICGVQVWLLIGVAQALKLPNAWLWGVGSCLCCVGLVVLLIVNQRATSTLNAAGIPVGFFGTKLPENPPV